MSGAIGEPNALAMVFFFVFIAASLGITWKVKPLAPDVADALSTGGSLPLPVLLVYRNGVLVRVLPGPRALVSVLDER